MDGTSTYEEPTTMVDGDESMTEVVEIVPQGNGAKRKLFSSHHSAQKVLDTKTGNVYASLYKCGLAMCTELGGNVKDTCIYYKFERGNPGRFIRLNSN